MNFSRCFYITNKLGVERSFLIKKLLSFYVASSSRDVFYQHLRQVFKTEGARQTCELKLVDKNRNQFDAQLESLLVQDSEGNFSRCRTAISDITERKRIEEAISLLASIVESSDDAIIGETLDGIILSWNYGAQKMYGYSADEVKGRPISILISPDHPNEVLQILERIRQGQRIEHYETLRIIKDGRRISVSLTISPIKDATGKIIGASTIARDISERKRMEEELCRAHDELEIRVQERTSELFEANKAIQKGISKLEKTDLELEAEIVKRKKAEQAEQNARVYAESIVETLRESLVVLDEQLRIVIANQTFYKTFKASLEETVDKFIYDLGNGQWNIPALKKLLEEIILKNTQFQDFEVEHEFPNIGRKTMLLNARQIYQRDVNKPLILLAIEDITEKKKLESQLLRAQRMESVGTLACGIAHDINNVLTPIMLSQELLQERLTDEESQRLLNTIERSTQRGANLMKQVQSFSKGAEGERNVLQVAHIISEIREIVEETFPRSIKIRTDIHKDLFTISGDATQLHQVVMNLCVNARDAMSDGGILSISAENFYVGENYARMNSEAKIGPYIVITVSDTGTGIPPEVMDRIFEPFFTTKEYGKGTGLGLSISHGIVKSHSGFITVYSEVGKGTAFKVYLPAITTTETLKAQEHQHELPAGNGESILVVDDEEQILEITKKTLKTHGYKAITANDGKEAIALYLQHREEIKLVLMDMMMPVMDGSASIRELCKVNPEIKIIAVSGLTEKDKLAKVDDVHVQAFLSKPYAAEKLLSTICDIISTK